MFAFKIFTTALYFLFVGDSLVWGYEACHWELPRVYGNVSMDEALLPVIIPPVVVQVSVTASQISSVANIATVSPGSVTQGSRMGALASLISCSFDDEFDESSLSWLDSPTQIALGNNEFRHHNGAVLGNWLIIGLIEGSHFALSKKYGLSKTRFPSFGILPYLYLLSPTTRSSTILARQGNALEKAFGVLSIGASSVVVLGMVRVLWPRNFQARFEFEKWKSLVKGSGFVLQYGLLFEDYYPEKYGFVVAESLMSMGSGYLEAIQAEPFVSCKSLSWGTVGVYGSFAVVMVVLQPQREKIDRYWSVGIAVSEATAALLAAVGQEIDPDRRNQALFAAAQILPVVVGYLVAARTLFDVGHTVYDRFHRVSRPDSARRPVLDLGALEAGPSIRPPVNYEPHLRTLVQFITSSRTRAGAIPRTIYDNLAAILTYITEQPRQ